MGPAHPSFKSQIKFSLKQLQSRGGKVEEETDKEDTLSHQCVPLVLDVNQENNRLPADLCVSPSLKL